MSERLRILALTTRRKISRRTVRRLRTKLQLGNDVQLELVTVFTPAQRLNVHRVDTFDLSLIPYRPAIPVSGEGLASWGGPRKLVARGLRVARKVGHWVRRRPPRVEPARALEVACATSFSLLHRAQTADVVLAVDDRAVPGAARLARRAPRPVVVRGAIHVRRTLELRGYALPPIPGLPLEVTTNPQPAKTKSIALPAAPEPAPFRVLIAPANYAGQAAAWAKALRSHVPHATAMNAQVGIHPKFPFPTDYEIDRDVFAGSLAWRVAWREFVLEQFTHMIAEVNRPILGSGTCDGQLDVKEFLRAGKTVALLSHGSDARIPSVHAAREPWHSYAALDQRTIDAYERSARRNTEIYNNFGGTVFVSTPGLLAFIPKATWLPLVINFDQWTNDAPPLERRLVRVAHIPSSSQKGSHMIDPILQSMHDRGLIEYVRAEGVRHQRMRAFYSSADIVVEQFGIADYSTAACEAMASGRVVVSRVADEVRAFVQATTGLELPIVEANPNTLEQVVLDLVGDRDAARLVAERGRLFCSKIHDGRRSAVVLNEWLGAPK